MSKTALVLASPTLGTGKFGRHQVARSDIKFLAEARPSRVPNSVCNLRLAIHQAVKIGSIEREQARSLQRDSGRRTLRLPECGNLAEEIARTEVDMLVMKPDLHFSVHDKIH